jgi:HEAT repeat protein
VDAVTVVWIAIGAVVAAFGLLLALIVATKARRQIRDLRRRRRRAALEPLVLRYGAAREGSIAALLPGPPGRLDRDVLEAILLDQIQAVRGSVRDRLVRACEELGLLDRQIALLASRRPWVRAEAAEKLGLMRSPRAAEPLARAMDDPVGEVRIRAARALGAVRGRAAVSKLVTALMEPNRWSAMRVADILTGMGEEAVADLMREMAHLPDPSRLLVIDIFGRVRSLRSIDTLRELLHDRVPDIRARAAHALGTIGDPGSVPALVAALADPEWPVRAMAAKALGRIPGDDAVRPLCGALTDSQWWVRANAAEALKGKGDEGHRALVSMLDSKDAYAREQAVLMLQESGVLDDYVARLSAPDKAERDRAVAVVARLVSLRRTDLLHEMAAGHPDSEVRRNLTVLLGLPPQPAGGTAA